MARRRLRATERNNRVRSHTPLADEPRHVSRVAGKTLQPQEKALGRVAIAQHLMHGGILRKLILTTI